MRNGASKSGKTLEISNPCGQKRSHNQSDVAKDAWTADDVIGLNEPNRKRAKKEGKSRDGQLINSASKEDGSKSIFANYVSPFIQKVAGTIWNSIGGSTEGSSNKAKTEREYDNEPPVLGLTVDSPEIALR